MMEGGLLPRTKCHNVRKAFELERKSWVERNSQQRGRKKRNTLGVMSKGKKLARSKMGEKRNNAGKLAPYVLINDPR